MPLRTGPGLASPGSGCQLPTLHTMHQKVARDALVATKLHAHFTAG